MKKITFTLASVLISFVSFAQDFSAVSNSSINYEVNSSQALLWDQPRESTGGIVSIINNIPTAVYAADDFELTDVTTLETITVAGFNNNQNLLANITGYSLYIYADLAGMPSSDPSLPGTGLLEIIQLAPTNPALIINQNGGNYDFVLDITSANGSPVVLPAGIYWLVAAPTLNIPGFGAGDRWNWAQGTAPAGTNIAHLIDVSDAFGGGFTTWTPFSDLGLAWTGLTFSVEGSVQLSIDSQTLSQISVYPNPTTDILNVQVPSNVEITGAVLYDILGKNTGAVISNGQINVSALSRGVYMLSLETTAGTLVKKVVKQ